MLLGFGNNVLRTLTGRAKTERVALSYLSGYEGIALFSRLFLNEPADITFKTPRFLTFKPAERILTRVSIAWFLVAFFLVKTTGFELALPVSNIGKLLS